MIEAQVREKAAEIAEHFRDRGSHAITRRWVVERSSGWMSRFRRSTREYERLPEILAGLHLIAFAALMVKRFVEIWFQSA